MLSLSPRYDLFRFAFPKEFIPSTIYEKYNKIINTTPGVITDPINYLNESIQTVTIPGIGDATIQQQQHSTNSITGAKKINTEPQTDITYNTSKNPLDCINKEITVTFRLNQGLYNYFMLYETIFYCLCKPLDYGPLDILYIDILNEDGKVISRIKYTDVYIDGLDGLDFDYSKVERSSDSFSLTLKFNNIDFDFMV